MFPARFPISNEGVGEEGRVSQPLEQISWTRKLNKCSLYWASSRELVLVLVPAEGIGLQGWGEAAQKGTCVPGAPGSLRGHIRAAVPQTHGASTLEGKGFTSPPMCDCVCELTCA